MSVLVFDTLTYANELKLAGVPEKQAEAHALLQAKLLTETKMELATKIAETKDDLATKQDLLLVKQELLIVTNELEKDVKELEGKIEVKISETKSDIVRWVVGLFLAQIAAQAALFTSLFKLMR